MTANPRTVATTATVAAAAFITTGAAVVGHKIPDQHWGTRGAVLDIAFALGTLAVAATLPTLAAHLRVRRPGRIATRVAQAGQAAMAVESLASTIHGGNTLGPVFLLGLFASLAGLAVLAIDGWRANRARVLALTPLLGLLVGIAGGDQGGAIVLGVVWGAIAITLTRREQLAPASLVV